MIDEKQFEIIEKREKDNKKHILVKDKNNKYFIIKQYTTNNNVKMQNIEEYNDLIEAKKKLDF